MVPPLPVRLAVNPLHLLKREIAPLGMAAANLVGIAVAGPRGIFTVAECVDLTDAREATEVVGHFCSLFPDVERASLAVAFVDGAHGFSLR